jgi:putative transposase
VKKSRFSEEKFIAVPKQWEAGVQLAELTRKHGVSEATLYNWKARYGGLTSRTCASSRSSRSRTAG